VRVKIVSGTKMTEGITQAAGKSSSLQMRGRITGREGNKAGWCELSIKTSILSIRPGNSRRVERTIRRGLQCRRGG